MKTKKRIELGEYIIKIVYDDVTGALDISVLDELEDVIETLNVINDEDPDNENDVNPSLN